MGRLYGHLRLLFFATVAAHIVTCIRCETELEVLSNFTAINTSDGAPPSSVGTLMEVHFLYLVEINSDSNSKVQPQTQPLLLSREEIGDIENSILHNIQKRHEDWNQEESGSTIIEINSSPRDTINREGFCAPTRNYTNCYLLNGAMSIRVLGGLEPAIDKFYNMTRDTMNMNVNEGVDNPNDFPWDGRYYFIRSTEEDNSVHNDEHRRESPLMFVLLVLLSIGIFCLTLAVIYLLFIRFTELKRNNNNSRSSNADTRQQNRDGVLGISAIDNGMRWLEVKSTSSSASSSSSMSSSTIPPPKGNALPKIVGSTSNSVCCSSVSELSILSIQSTGTSESLNLKLEKIEEEGPSMEISIENGESLCLKEENLGGNKEEIIYHNDGSVCGDDEEAQLIQSAHSIHEGGDTKLCASDVTNFDNEEGTFSTNQESSFVTTTSSFQSLDATFNTPSKREDANDGSLIFSTPLSELDSVVGSMKSI